MFDPLQESECACDQCVMMCRTIPCRPLPMEVVRMPRAVQARLMLDLWGSTLTGTPHLMSGAVGHEGDRAPDFDPCFGKVSNAHTCTFLTGTERCELHGKCKPYEGRVAHHDARVGGRDVLLRLKEAWESPFGRRVLRLWRRRFLPEVS